MEGFSMLGNYLDNWASAYKSLQELGEAGFYKLNEAEQYRLFCDLPPPILLQQFLELEAGVKDADSGEPFQYDSKKEFFDNSNRYIPTQDQERLYAEHLEEKSRRSRFVSFRCTPKYTLDGRSVKNSFRYAKPFYEVGMYELVFERILDHLQESPNLSLKHLAQRRSNDVKPKNKQLLTKTF
jgi:hypothetical protein